MTTTPLRSGGQAAGVGPPAAGTRLPSIAGLRVLAILGVFLSHVDVFMPIPYTHGLFVLLSAGRTFFFVLSGFVLVWTFSPRDTKGWFYGRRFARIYPLMAVAAIVPAIFAITSNDPTLKVDKSHVVMLTVYSLALVLAWIPDLLQSPNPVVWSISSLAFAYAVFPFIVRPLLRRSLKQLAWIAVALITYSWAVRIVLWFAYPPQRVVDQDLLESATWLTLGNYSPLVRIADFAIGMIAAVAVRKGWRGPSLRASSWLLAAGMFVLWLLRDQTFRLHLPFDVISQWTMPLFGLFIVSYAVHDIDGKKSRLGSPSMTRLSKWSYAFFLFHVLPMFPLGLALYPDLDVVDFFLAPAPGRWSNVLWALLVLAVATTASALLYRYVESPLDRRLRRWMKPRLAERTEPPKPATSQRAA